MPGTGFILVTGANGFVGRALVQHFEGRSRRVLAGVRMSAPLAMGFGNEFLYGSLESMPPLAERLSGVTTIVHCAGLAHVTGADDAETLVHQFHAVNCEGTLHLAREAHKAGVERLIFLSTIGVNGDQTTGTPFRPSDEPNPRSHYAASKLQAELGLRKFAAESGLEVVIIRPPLIVGAGAIGNVGSIARMIQKGVPLPFGRATHNRRTIASIETMCSLIEACVDHPLAAGNTFLAGDSKERSTREIIELVGEYIGRSPRFLPLPAPLLTGLLLFAGKGKLANQIFGDLEVDISEAIKVLGWQPSK